MSELSNELSRLARLEHPDPHALLGAHPEPGGVRVRAWRPDAAEVLLCISGREPMRMHRIHPDGIFEGWVDGAGWLGRYEIDVRHANGARIVLQDPYAFPPTLGEVDLHLFSEGRHEQLHERFGARVLEHDGVRGTAFTVWAPEARGVSVVGDWNGWDGRLGAMRRLGGSGVWELFVPGVVPGARYKLEVRPTSGPPALKTDPLARAMEPPPATASVVWEPRYLFGDSAWIRERERTDWLKRPISIYEVHLGSWRRGDGGRELGYREIAPLLADHVTDLGFTHVELLPVMEHPFGGSWGYQVSGYFAPTARWGSPDDFCFLVDCLHQRGIGVLLDWVPAHFPRDAFALGRFDGTALYEHLDPRLGEHPDWGTYVFNYGRTEVREFLIASALSFIERHHADGLRVDAVASMLYLDYSRKQGEWLANRHGGRENLDAIELLQRLNEVLQRRHPGVLSIAEESTAWPKVTHPTPEGGLGFGLKWNMGWMHDTLEYFSKDPVHRRHHHRNLNFGLLYAYTENFLLPLSHDEVVHGKRSLLEKMPGSREQQLASLRSLYAYMWAYPGKKLLFMGGDIAQAREWNHEQSLDWHLLADPGHAGVQTLIRDLNRIYRERSALWRHDHDASGFEWLVADDADRNVLAFVRRDPESGRELVCACNFSAIDRADYRLPLPRAGVWQEILNTDAKSYSGRNIGNHGRVIAEVIPALGHRCSSSIVLPALGVLWLEHADDSR